MDAVLFHNPTAGDGDHSQEQLLSLLHDADIVAEYCSIKGARFPAMLETAADLFVVAGGDGTVAKVLKRMPDRKVPVAILPLGTANNIACSLGIEGDAKTLVEGWKKARRQPFEIGLALGPWGREMFVEAIGVGCLAESMARIDAVRIEHADGLKHGRDQFRKMLSEAKPIPFSISIDGRVVEQELLMLEILNVPRTGPGLPLGPANAVGDGLLDLVSVPADSRDEMMAWLAAEKTTAPAPAVTEQGRKIIVRWRGAPLRLDDTRLSAADRADKVTVELDDKAVTILVPNSDRTSVSSTPAEAA